MMKRFLLILLLFITSVWIGVAQPGSAYVFTKEVKEPVFEFLESPTVIGSKLYGADLHQKLIIGDTGVLATDLLTTKGIDIGFDFTFGGMQMNKFAVIANGSVFLGRDSVTAIYATNQNDAKINYVINNLFAGVVRSSDTLDMDGNPPAERNTRIAYKLEGSSPDRILTIEFKNLQLLTVATQYDTAAFQVRLYEGSNKIEIRYKKMESTNLSSSGANFTTFYVGLKTLHADLPIYVYCANSTKSKDWTGTAVLTKTSYASNTMSFSGKNTSYPAPGLSFTFAPPPECQAPESSPSAFRFTSVKSDRIEGAFTKAEGSDGSLIVISEGSKEGVNPENGKNYSAFDSIGNAVVIPSGVTTNNTFKTYYPATNLPLSPSTAYTIAIYSYNNICTGGPVYNLISLDSLVSTAVGPPSLSVSKVTDTAIRLKVESDKSNAEVLVYMNTIPQAQFDIDNPASSFIQGEKNVGDTLEDGSVVVYKGVAAEFSIRDLSWGTDCYFSALSYQGNPNMTTYYSERNSQITARTWDKIPVQYSAEKEWLRAGVLPAGWSASINNPKDRDGNGNYAVHQSIFRGTQIVGIQLLSFHNSTGKEVKPMCSDVITPNIQLGKGRHRLIFNFDFGTGMPTTTASAGSPEEIFTPISLNSSDSLLIQIVTEEGVYKTIASINNSNYVEQTVLAKKIVFIDGYENKRVQIRFVFYSPRTLLSRITNVKVEASPDCDYVSDIVIPDSTITTSSMLIHFNDEMNEPKVNQFNIAYKTKTSDWLDTVTVSGYPVLLEGLLPQTAYEVKIQAVCTPTSSGLYSDISPVAHTRWQIPFVMDFEQWDHYLPSLPPFWTTAFSAFSNTDTINIEGNSDNWVSTTSRIGKNASHARGIQLNVGLNDWLLMPLIDLGEGDVKTQVSFDYYLGFMGGENPPNGTTTYADTRFIVAVSTDSGKTFTPEHTLLMQGTGYTEPLKNIDSAHLTLPLKNYKSGVQIGFYVGSTSGYSSNDILMIDNIKINYSCPAPSALTASEIGEDTVNLAWTSNSDALEYKLRYKVKGNENYQYISVSNQNKLTLSALTPDTVYQWAVRGVCAVEDSSLWIESTFRTLKPYICDTITNDKRVANGRNQVSFVWTSEAKHFNVSYKKVSASEWLSTKVDTNFITFSNLDAGTAYQYKIQAQCSEDATDVSLWTNPKNFTTLPVTCQTPRNFHLIKAEYMSLAFAFESDAEKGLLALKKVSDSVWGTPYEFGSADTISISPLFDNTLYQAKIRAVCTVGDSSLWSEVLEVATVEVPACEAPKNLKSSAITTNTASLTWGSTSDGQIMWTICYKKSSDMQWDTVKMRTTRTHELTNLKPNTDYSWKVQGTCDEYLTSDYSTVATFTSLDNNNDNCFPPTNLATSALTKTSASLSWSDTSNAHSAWNICHKAASVEIWDTIKLHNLKNVDLSNLQINTPYVWKVQGVCAENLLSAYSGQAEFTTQGTSIEDIQSIKSSFIVFADKGQIHIRNLAQRRIEKAEIINLNGQCVLSFDLQTTDHAIIPTSLSSGVFILKLMTNNQSIGYKLIIQ